MLRPGCGSKHPRMTPEYLLVLCTCPDDASAAAIATALVQERLAACVSRHGGLKSMYRWQGRIESSDEILLQIKSKTSLFAELEAEIRRLHPYDTPEVIGIPVLAGSADYLEWIRSETR